jgi:hypothetical protein
MMGREPARVHRPLSPGFQVALRASGVNDGASYEA